jgi:hypothetical protein
MCPPLELAVVHVSWRRVAGGRCRWSQVVGGLNLRPYHGLTL